MMTIDEAREHFERLRSSAPKLKAKIRFVDGRTDVLMERHGASGDVCLLGSKTYGMTTEQISNWRGSYTKRGHEFVGIDIAEGPNVDVVTDLCDPQMEAKHPELISRFGWVICGALLEHVISPQVAAANIEKLIKPGGLILFQGPWVWGFHAYPDDYWRLSISALKTIFPAIDWVEWYYSGTLGKWGVAVDDPSLERALFLVDNKPEGAPTSISQLISDRAIAYLNVTAIGRKPTA